MISPPAGPVRMRRRVLAIAGLACLLELLWLGSGLTVRHVIGSSGGLYFFKEVSLAVPEFRQGDPRWKDDSLGGTGDTLGSAGCALASAAMVLRSYGADTDPKRLNDYLTRHAGYEGNGYLIWEKAAEAAGTLGVAVEKAYEDAPSYWEIDSQLIHGNPVIVRIHFPDGATHFVVIAGKHGFDYLIRDPGAGWARGLYPLKDIVPAIDGLRYYRRTG